MREKSIRIEKIAGPPQAWVTLVEIMIFERMGFPYAQKSLLVSHDRRRIGVVE